MVVVFSPQFIFDTSKKSWTFQTYINTPPQPPESVCFPSHLVHVGEKSVHKTSRIWCSIQHAKQNPVSLV